VKTPGVVRAPFTDSRLAAIWLPVRLWLGAMWLQGAFVKLTDPAWMGSGETLRQFLVGASTQAGIPWYRDFIGFLLDSGAYLPMTKVVAFGELAVGLGVLAGGLTGPAAFFGVTMNLNYLLAASTGPDVPMLVAGGLLLLAWKTAGHIGADYVLLPFLRMLWERRPEKGRALGQALAAHPRVAPRAVTVFSVAAVVLLALASFESAGAPTAATFIEGPTATVPTGGNDFRPAAIAVRAGTTVTWTNSSKIAHTVTSGKQPAADGRFDSGPIRAGEGFSYTFEAPGVYSYFCAYHPGMAGTVTVVGAIT
jgi:thiosulfate dehydrogenase [quinone] large subunit